MELTKKAEALKQDLSLSKLCDVLIEVCEVVDGLNEINTKEVKKEEPKKNKK
jgi:hypothetical protein